LIYHPVHFVVFERCYLSMIVCLICIHTAH
jgi:hypothetical protein